MIEWQNNPPQEYMTWYEAVDYAESLGDGWRLPTRGELIDAYDSSVIGFMSGVYWSSSTYAHDNNNAWYVFLYNGVVDYSDTTNNYYVRCVREVKGKDIDPHKLDSSRIIIDRGELKMNKDEMQNKIEQLENRLKNLNEAVINTSAQIVILQDELQKLKPLFRPQENGRWERHKKGYCIHKQYKLHFDPMNTTHNCFRTKELAGLRAKQREAEDELFNIWEHLVGNWRPNNKYQVWHVVWNNYKNVPISFADSQPGEITIYKLFPTSELAMKQYELASDHARAYIRGEF
jgi:hypothetical protein